MLIKLLLFLTWIKSFNIPKRYIKFNQNNLEEQFSLIYDEKTCKIVSDTIHTYIYKLKRYMKNRFEIQIYLLKRFGTIYFSRIELLYVITRNCKVDLYELMHYNLMTEFGSGMCTSVIFREDITNKVWLLSNLDWSMDNILIKSKFNLIAIDNNNEIIFEALGFYGMIGFTRVQTQKWAMTFNLQYSENLLYDGIKRYSVLELFFDTTFKNLDYESTFNIFVNTPTYVGGFYLIINENEGSLINKYTHKKSIVNSINSRVKFIVQTNSDRNEKKEYKRNLGEKILSNGILNYKKVEKLLSISPFFVKYSTFFTTFSSIGKKFKIVSFDDNVKKN